MGEWRKTRGRFFASLKNDRDAGVKGGWLDLAGGWSGVGA